jgi:hypothetical protein
LRDAFATAYGVEVVGPVAFSDSYNVVTHKVEREQPYLRLVDGGVARLWRERSFASCVRICRRRERYTEAW